MIITKEKDQILSVTDKVEIKVSHLDKNYQVKVGAYITFLINCEMDHIDVLTHLSDFCQDNHVGIFLVFRQIDLFKPAEFKQTLLVKTFPIETRAFLGHRNTIIHNEKGELVVASYSLGSFINFSTGAPIRLPQYVLDSIVPSPKFEMQYTNRRVVLDEEAKLVNEGKVEIFDSHIDIYKHVNNLFYVQFILDFIDFEFSYNRIRTEYNYPLEEGDVALIRVYLKDNVVTGLVLTKDEKVCAKIELSTRLDEV